MQFANGGLKRLPADNERLALKFSPTQRTENLAPNCVGVAQFLHSRARWYEHNFLLSP